MELVDNILWHLKQAWYFSLTAVNDAVSGHGVSTAQIGVLRQLANEPGLSGAGGRFHQDSAGAQYDQVALPDAAASTVDVTGGSLSLKLGTAFIGDGSERLSDLTKLLTSGW